MPNSVLRLSAHQQQVLTDLDLDAWYLTPLTDKSAQHDDQQAAISERVAALSAALSAADNEPTKPHVAQSVGDTAASAVSSAANSSPVSAANLPPQVVEHLVSQAETAADNAIAKSTAESVRQTTQQTGNTAARSALPPPIQLAAKPAMLPPEHLIDFPNITPLAANQWQAVEQSIKALQSTDAALPTLRGSGALAADWFIVMPPILWQEFTLQQGELSDLAASTEQQPFSYIDVLSSAANCLLREWLDSVGLGLDKVYITPLLKQMLKMPRDPESEALASDFAILQAELALVQPKHIVLMGRLPCQRLLDSSAPLSVLMQSTYQLRYNSDNGSRQSQVSCLPSLDYFLAVPAQKSQLWQLSKAFLNRQSSTLC